MHARIRDTSIGLAIIITTVIVLWFIDSIVLVDFLYVLGGLILAAMAFSSKCVRSIWGRYLLGASAVLLMLNGTVELLRYYSVWVPSAPLQQGLPHMIDTLYGVVLGFLLALSFSGELSRRKPSDHDKIV